MSFLQVSSTNFFKTKSGFVGHSTLGNRSPISLKKMGLSSVTIFGTLKSLSALISRGSSGISGSPLFSLPAYLSTDLTALRPQS